MKSLRFKMPDRVEFGVPHDYAKNFPSQGVSIINEQTPEGFTVGWDDESIYFSARGATVVYRRAAIVGFNVNRDFRNSLMNHTRLEVELCDVLLPVFYSHKQDELAFDELLGSLFLADLPFDIRPVPPHDRRRKS